MVGVRSGGRELGATPSSSSSRAYAVAATIDTQSAVSQRRVPTTESISVLESHGSRNIEYSAEYSLASRYFELATQCGRLTSRKKDHTNPNLARCCFEK